MTWRTGNWSSYPPDGSAFLEKDNDGNWWAYETGEDGGMPEGFPKLREEPFTELADAQAWVEARSTVPE